MKLLVVDDQHSVFQYLQKVVDVDSIGFHKMLYAENGVKALELIREERPEAMLLDIQMPLMNGLELLERLASSEIKQPETIVLTAYDEFDYAKKCIRYGVQRYALKPIDPDEILDALKDIAGKIKNEKLKNLREAMILECAGSKTLCPCDQNAGCIAYGILCFRKCDESAVLPCLVSLPRDCSHLKEMCYYCLCVSSEEDWQQIIGGLKAQIGKSASIGASRHHTHLHEVHAALEEARAAFEMGFYSPGVFDSYKERFRPMGSLSPAALMNLFDMTEANHIPNVKNILSSDFRRFEQEGFAPQDVFRACEHCLICLESQYGKLIAGERIRKADEVLYWNADSLYRLLVDAFTEIMDRNGPSGYAGEEEAIKQIKNYIDEHFQEDLSLHALSAKFFMSRFQISRLFKQLYQVNYQDYILSVRMNAAAHMLACSQKLLYEISNAVGIEDASYFSSLFKKYYGVTPRTYRMKMQGDDPS